jgi:tetratricopeptide (TPR) repeat protein
MVHAFAGNLLMTTGSYDDATKAFTNADKVHPCAFAIYQRARCYLALGDIKNSMNDLYQSCAMYSKNNTNTFKSGDSIATHPNPIALRDKNCLETILNSLDFLNTNSTSVSKQSVRNK